MLTNRNDTLGFSTQNYPSRAFAMEPKGIDLSGINDLKFRLNRIEDLSGVYMCFVGELYLMKT